jgi:hypothetical protein
MKRSGIVKTKIAEGRYELGWEVGALSAAAFNAAGTPIIGIQVNNDADFLVQKVHVYEFGAAGSKFILDPAYSMQIKDSASGNVFYRQPGSPYHLAQMPYIPRTAIAGNNFGRFGMNDKGMPAPYLLRRACSAFIEFSKLAGAPAVVGDVYVVFEGFRIYPGEREPVPASIEGYNTPFAWSAQVAIPNGLAAGLQALGNVALPGPGLGKYILKDFTVAASGTPVAVGGYLPTPDCVLGFQVQDTRQQQKNWARNPNPLPAGVLMPGLCLSGSGMGLPWVWPRYLDGQDQILLTIFSDPAAWTGGNPGTLDVSFNGVCIYG